MSISTKEQCSWCDKKAVLTCPDCGWEACEDHSRKDGKCYNCTKYWKADPKKVELIRKLGEAIEFKGKVARKLITKAIKEYNASKMPTLKEKIDKFYDLYSGFLDGIEPCLLEEDNDSLIEMGTLLDEMKEEIYKL